MSIFKLILFVLIVDNDGGILLRIVHTSLTDEVKDIFVSAFSTLNQERLVAGTFLSLDMDIFQEPPYRSRINRFPFLFLTLVIFML